MKTLLFLLGAFIAVSSPDLCAQQLSPEQDNSRPIPPGLYSDKTAIPRTTTLQLDSVWESGFVAQVGGDSVVYLKEFYSYVLDTLQKKDVFYYLPDEAFYQRETKRLNPDLSGADFYTFTEEYFDNTLDTSELTVNYYNPLWPTLSDSTIRYSRPVDAEDLHLYSKSSAVYNANQDVVTSLFESHDLSSGQYVYGGKSEYTYLADDQPEEALFYRRFMANAPWDLNAKEVYHYTGNLRDTAYKYDYLPGSGFSPSQLTTIAYNATGKVTHFRIFNWDGSSTTPSFFVDLTYDDQDRLMETKSEGYNNGVADYGTQVFYTYLTDDYVQLEKDYTINTPGGGYTFSTAREFFYSGASGIAEHAPTEPLVLAPNPVWQSLRISATAGTWLEIRAADGSGRLSSRLSEEGVNTVDVSSLPTGVYFAMTWSEAGVRSGVFVKL